MFRIILITYIFIGIQVHATAQKTERNCSLSTSELEHPRFVEYESERKAMVGHQIIPSGIDDEEVINAMKEVPRHLFVPSDMQPYAYENTALPIGYQQTISQPFVVAYMTQLLELDEGHKVLEIGTGSGYQAAVLSEITPCVFTIEIIEALGNEAIARFKDLGYTTIKTKIGDGYQGWAEHAPFDRIILTAAPEKIPQPLINQLKPGGILIAPVGTDVQFITKIIKDEQGELTTERKIPVRFVPMTGEQEKN